MADYKIPSRGTVPLFKFGLVHLGTFTERKPGFNCTNEIFPGFAVPALILEKVPTPEQIEAIRKVLEEPAQWGA